MKRLLFLLLLPFGAYAQITTSPSGGGSFNTAANYATTGNWTPSAGTWDFSSVTVNLGTLSVLPVATIELGNASDTTLSRGAAGVLDVEGVVIPSVSSTNTLTNKRVTPRITTITSSATPTVNTDNTDCVTITALAAAITSMTTNLSGTPSNFDQLEFRILDNGTARAITWGASFLNGPATWPTTTVSGKALHAYGEWDSVRSGWVCMFTASDP